MNVTISLDSLRKQSGTAGGELDWAGPVTAEAVRRIACDATVTRIILGPDSEILDVGRTNRLVTPAQRKALAARDGGCTWTGCTRPPWWTDAHHLTSWADGGETNLNNLRLLCRTHHRWTHQGRRPSAARVPGSGRHNGRVVRRNTQGSNPNSPNESSRGGARDP